MILIWYFCFELLIAILYKHEIHHIVCIHYAQNKTEVFIKKFIYFDKVANHLRCELLTIVLKICSATLHYVCGSNMTTWLTLYHIMHASSIAYAIICVLCVSFESRLLEEAWLMIKFRVTSFKHVIALQQHHTRVHTPTFHLLRFASNERRVKGSAMRLGNG